MTAHPPLPASDQAVHLPDVPTENKSPLARRLFMVGGAAAAGSAVAAVASSDPASAGHNTNIAYDSQTVLHADVTNTTAGSTRVASNIAGTAAFVALNNYPVGISRPDGLLARTAYTTSNCAGVAGTCESVTRGIGVMGTAKSVTGTGVYAYSGSVVPSTLAPDGTGLYASGPLNGVVALARNDNGVALTATAPPAGGHAAVLDGPTKVVGKLEVDGSVDAETVRADGLRLTRTAGKKTLKRKRRKVTISGVPVTAGSVVVATLQKAQRGVYVAAAQPAPSGQKVTIIFNKKAPRGTVVGWIVVN